MSPGSLAHGGGRPDGTTESNSSSLLYGDIRQKAWRRQAQPWRVASGGTDRNKPDGGRDNRRLADARERVDSSRCSAARAPAAPPRL